jgi:hypothetical protein
MQIARSMLACSLTMALICPAALACSCFRTDTDESRFRQATHVFTARVTEAKEIRDGERSRVEATVSITETFKGQPNKLPRLWSYIPFGKDSNSCAVAFTVGENYVFLIGDDGRVEYCSGSRQYNPALEKPFVENLRVLSRGKTL